MPYRLRTATAGDIPAIVPLLDAAYGRSPTFEARFRRYLAIEPGGWVVAERQSAPIAVGGFVSFGRCAYIGLMAVSPDEQRRGIGAAIFEDVLRRCDARGCGLLLLDASASGAPLYERYSFDDHHAALTFAIEPRAGVADDVTTGVRVHAIDDPGGAIGSEVASFDASCYGADRSALIRSLLLADGGRAFLARDSAGCVVGYAVGQTRSVGPCMARTTEVARALLDRVLALPYEDRVSWLVPSSNREAVALANALGAAHTRTHRHMRRGDDTLLASDWSQLFAKASFAVG